MTLKQMPPKNSVEILIAEDSPTQGEALRYLLEAEGYRVTLARDGKKALDYLDRYRPALIISDILMPTMDGYEFCQRIKSEENTSDIPFFLLTSLSETADVMQGLACGADRFISKPYNNSYLLSQIAEALEETSTLPSDTRAPVELDIIVNGKPSVIKANPQRVVSLVLSIYEAAIHRNIELRQTQEKLQLMNEQLEEMVEQRTATLSAEIIGREHLQKELLFLSIHDELTGLCNRRGFMILSEQYWHLAVRTGQFFALLFMDVDDLKMINDTYGHIQGDQALEYIARAMEQTFRQSDILARYGGDEFTALITDCDEATARVAIKRLAHNIQQMTAKEMVLPSVSLSIGLAHFDPAHPTNLDDLLVQADADMYAEKSRKKGVQNDSYKAA